MLDPPPKFPDNALISLVSRASLGSATMANRGRRAQAADLGSEGPELRRQKDFCVYPLCAVRPAMGVSLIEIKAADLTSGNACIDEPDGVRAMPTEIIVIAIVISVFCTFAGALYWGDLQTRGPGKEADHPSRR